MAKFGERLTEPEIGWKRIDDSSPLINYTGNIDVIEKVLVCHNNEYKRFNGINWETITILEPTEQDFSKNGMNHTELMSIPQDSWSELIGDIEIRFYTNAMKRIDSRFNIETEPFTLAEEFDEQTIKVIEYTDNPVQEESSITLQTEPFTYYDEVGDSFDVLYYTDDPDKSEAELEINHNHSPWDELDGDFELVTWTMEEEKKVQEELKPIYKEKLDDGDLYRTKVDLSKGIVKIK